MSYKLSKATIQYPPSVLLDSIVRSNQIQLRTLTPYLRPVNSKNWLICLSTPYIASSSGAIDVFAVKAVPRTCAAGIFR